MRIVKWQYKLLYVVVSYLTGAILFRLLPAHGIALAIGSTVFPLAQVFLGARIFRGRSEEVSAPRAWWRMTSKRPLSKRLGILFSVFSVVTAIGATLSALRMLANRHGAVLDPTEQFASAVLYAVLAFFYLNCAVRLNRVPRPVTGPPFGGSSPLIPTDEPNSAQPVQPDAAQSS